MKCEIIKDLLPAYSDGVCSEETKKAIDEHIKDCEECSQLLKVYKTDIHVCDTDINKNAEKPFRKIKNKLFRSKIINITLAAALAILVAVGVGKFGYLAYGDITKEPDHRSFGTIIFEKKGSKLINRFTEGDIDFLLNNVVLDTFLSNYEDVEEYRKNVLTEFYNDCLKDKNPQLTVKYTDYCTDNNGGIFLTSKMSLATDDSTITFWLYGNYNSYSYSISIDKISGYAEKYFNKLSSVFECDTNFSVWEDMYKHSMNFAIHDLLTGRFIGETEDYSENLNNRIDEFMNGMICESFDINNFRFDKDNQNFFVDMNIIFSDKNENRIVYTNTFIYYPYKYMVYPDSKPVIINDGISDEKAEQLINLF